MAPPEVEQRPRFGPGFWLYAGQLWMVFGIAASNILLGLATLLALTRQRRGRLDLDRFRPMLLPLGWLVTFFVLSITFSYEPLSSLGDLDDLFSLFPLLLAPIFIRTPRAARLAIDGLIVVGTAIAAMGLYQVLTGPQVFGTARRMTGPFSHYQTMAGFLVFCAVLALASILFGSWRRPLPWIGFSVILVALGVNLTRGSWLALVVAAVFLLAMRAPRALILVVPVLLVLGLMTPAPIRERAASIFDLRDESNYDRIAMLWAGSTMIAERPLLGLGPQVVQSRYPIYRHPTAPGLERSHLHNTYLQMAAERGTLSLVAWLWLVVVALQTGRANWRREGRSDGPHADLHLGAIAALLAYTVAGLFEDNFRDTEVQRVALFVIALPFCLSPAADPNDELPGASS